MRPISMRLLIGILTPAMRAIPSAVLALALLVARVLADHQHRAAAADHFALLAHGLDGCSYLHLSRTGSHYGRDRSAGPRSRAAEQKAPAPARGPEPLRSKILAEGFSTATKRESRLRQRPSALSGARE